jgi:ligand-binding SRPBCC domain-containing protein
MPSLQRSLTIDAPPARVYEAFTDFDRWLEWNPHLRKVRPLCEGPLEAGCTARIALKLSPLTSIWEVTEVNPGRSFAWASFSFPGVRLVFDHIAEAFDGGTVATLRIDIEGPLAFLTPLTGAIYTRNLDRSLAALKRMLEAEAAAKPRRRKRKSKAEREGDNE